MSETPRTSAVLDAGFGKDPLDRYANVIVIAKTLERELTAEKARSARLENLLIEADALLDDPRGGPAANELADRIKALLGDTDGEEK